MRRELLIGCGNRRIKHLSEKGHEAFESLTTLDIDPHCGADVAHDLNILPLPFPDDSFDEIHAYEVLEHVGRQGDWRFFLDQWSDFWRVLRPGGHVFASVPHETSPWLWGDPGHTRLISECSLTFLCQPEYEQVGKTAMTDYRAFYRADFDRVHTNVDSGTLLFALRAVKPSRIK